MMCLPTCLLFNGVHFVWVPYHGDSPHQVCQKVAAARCRTKPADPVLPGNSYSQFPDFCKWTAIAYHQNCGGLANPGPVCNSGPFHERQEITSTRVEYRTRHIGISLPPSLHRTVFLLSKSWILYS